ncbi:MAG: hypothetical protein ACHQ17_11880 [Polyangia bacterium]
MRRGAALALVAGSLALASAVLFATLSFAGEPKDPSEPAGPYRIWWSYPKDVESAIEIDDPDLHVSRFASRWSFVTEISHCDRKKEARLLRKRQEGEGTPLREVRVEQLDDEGQVHATSRCVQKLADWRTHLGKPLVERLEDELDAHVDFLYPRRRPGMPAKLPMSPKDGGAPK